MSPAEATEVAVVDRARNASDCRDGLDSCDRSKLTEREATALAVANQRRRHELVRPVEINSV
jgi:hypothetical protein